MTAEDGREVEFPHHRGEAESVQVIRVVPVKQHIISMIGVGLTALGMVWAAFSFTLDARMDQKINLHSRDENAHQVPTASLRAHLAESKYSDIDKTRLNERLDRFETKQQTMLDQLVEVRTQLAERTRR